MRTFQAAVVISFIAATAGRLGAADLALFIPPSTPGSTIQQALDKASLKRWELSIAPVFASQALDVASSFGMREMNPLLAGSDGRFGAKGAGIKFGATAGFVGIQYLVVRKYPRSARVFAKLNWSVSIVTTGLAAHNFAVR